MPNASSLIVISMSYIPADRVPLLRAPEISRSFFPGQHTEHKEKGIYEQGYSMQNLGVPNSPRRSRIESDM